MSTTGMLRRSGTIVIGLAALAVAAPASAATEYGPYTNTVTRKYEGNWTWIDCGSCPQDHVVQVTNVKNGYHVRVQLQIDVRANNVFHTYLDRYVNDGYTGKWKAPAAMPHGKARIRLCFYNRSWDRVGSCNTTYFWHRK